MFAHSPFIQLADRDWVAVAEPATVNVGLIGGTHSALMVDTGSHPDQGRVLQEAAERICGLPVRHAVVTHAHWDHWFGLAGLVGVTSWGHRALVSAARQDDEPPGLGVGDDQIRLPDQLIDDEVSIDLGDRLVRLWQPGLGHTSSDLVVEIPDAKLLFTGDLLESAGPPQAGPDAHLPHWPATIDRLLAGREGWVFVPGHGPLMSFEQARAQRDS